MRECKVYFGKLAQAVQADTLFYAAGWAMAYWIPHGLMRRSEVGNAIFTISVDHKVYRVRAASVHRWLQIGDKNLKAGLTKEMIIDMMNSRG